MSNILLLHHSHNLYPTLKPPDPKRPLFYWYSDRFVSHLGSTQYLNLCVVNPKQDSIGLRSRNEFMDFDMLHKNFLHYKGSCEGTHPEWCTCDPAKRPKYEESGIAMSFSEITPSIVLMARSYASGKPYSLQSEYEIIEPYVPFSKRIISLFEEPYDQLFTGKPIKFTDIPELAALLPDSDDLLPFKDIEPDNDGFFHYEDWLPMVTEKNGIWM